MIAISPPIARFRPRFALVLGLALLALSPLAALSDAPSPDQPAQEPTREILPGLLKAPRETLSPRLLEIRDRLEWEQEKLAELSEAYHAARNEEEALRIQREIHDLKAGTEMAVLEIQLRHARLEGKPELVERLETMLEKARNPEAQVPSTKPAARRAGGR